MAGRLLVPEGMERAGYGSVSPLLWDMGMCRNRVRSSGELTRMVLL